MPATFEEYLQMIGRLISTISTNDWAADTAQKIKCHPQTVEAVISEVLREYRDLMENKQPD